MHEPPYPVEVKPYGRALVELARRRADVLCLSGDLTRQTEVDLFQAEFPDRFIHGGMAEANMMGMAGALDGGFGIQMFGHIAKKGAVHGAQHIASTVDYVREGRKNNFD